jgi:serine/threonine-protein kinase
VLRAGDTFGAYRIIARLKAGGMARLYLARRDGVAGFRRLIALKVIHAHLAREPEFVRMFIDEATLSSKIHDPNVVHVEDLGEIDGTLYLAMEYVHGVALANLLRAASVAQRLLSPGFVAHIGAQIASGLHAAHETTDDAGQPLHIVHRDVSPQNVLLAFKGHVKVIDFGVAKALGQQHATQSGEIQGKLGYMAPEQAWRGAQVDRRADVYALGVVLWEMLAGERLFKADNHVALLESVRNPRIEPPSRRRPYVPKPLDDVIMHLLDPKVEGRPPTAMAVKRMLLDAVPEARSIEADDVAALLRALMPDEIAEQEKLLAGVDVHPRGKGSVFVAADEAPTLADERSVDPVEALHQLTVQAVVLPPTIAVGQRPPRAPRSRASDVLLLAIGAAVLATLLVVAVVKRSLADRTAAAPTPPTAPATIAPVAPATTPDPILPAAPAPSAPPPVETSPTVGVETPTLPRSETPEPAQPGHSVTTVAAPPPIRRPASTSKPKKEKSHPTPPFSGTARGSRCVFVGEVELCE